MPFLCILRSVSFLGVRANNYSSTHGGERNDMTPNEVFSAMNIMPSVVAGVVVAFIIVDYYSGESDN